MKTLERVFFDRKKNIFLRLLFATFIHAHKNLGKTADILFLFFVLSLNAFKTVFACVLYTFHIAHSFISLRCPTLNRKHTYIHTKKHRIDENTLNTNVNI